MSKPNLPLITLRHGPWQAEVYDPRPFPGLLGARFVHGGWVRSLTREGRELTGGVVPSWHPFDAHGLPETFESGLGWHLVEKGQEFLRPGCGRLIRTSDDPNEDHSNATLSSILDWQVESGPDHAVFRTEDATRRHNGYRFGYRLERQVRLGDEGLVSTTTFTLETGMLAMLPVSWFAHPFFPHARTDATAFTLPAAAQLMPRHRFSQSQGGNAERGADGRWRIQPGMYDAGRAVFGGLWGSREPSLVHLDGGGALAIAVSAPLDHLVLWAGARSASLEPKLARTAIHGEAATWSLSYRWQEQA